MLTYDHIENYRIHHPRKDDFYVVDGYALDLRTGDHISYHPSGRLHWKGKRGEPTTPAEGEADARRAALLNEAVSLICGEIDGYCIAAGPGLSLDSLATMVSILDGYIVPPIAYLVDVSEFQRRGRVHFPTPLLPEAVAARRMLAEARANGQYNVVSADEMMRTMRKQFPNAQVQRRASSPQSYACYDQATIQGLYKLAHGLIDKKMEQKPLAFWTDQTHDQPSQPTASGAQNNPLHHLCEASGYVKRSRQTDGSQVPL